MLTPFDPLTRLASALVLGYLDPGSGSLVLQMLLAGVAGAVVFFKFQGKRMLDFLLRRGDRDEDDDGGE